MNASQHSNEKALLPFSGKEGLLELYHHPVTVHGEIYEFVNPNDGTVEVDVIPEDVEEPPFSFEVKGTKPHMIDRNLGYFVATASNVKVFEVAA